MSATGLHSFPGAPARLPGPTGLGITLGSRQAYGIMSLPKAGGVSEQAPRPTRLAIWDPKLGSTTHQVPWPDGAAILAVQVGKLLVGISTWVLL